MNDELWIKLATEIFRSRGAPGAAACSSSHADRRAAIPGVLALCPGDVIAVCGPRQTLLGEVEVHADEVHADEVHDVELLNLPATVVDVVVTNAALSTCTGSAAGCSPSC
jgi:hypothetical protein